MQVVYTRTARAAEPNATLIFSFLSSFFSFSSLFLFVFYSLFFPFPTYCVFSLPHSIPQLFLFFLISPTNIFRYFFFPIFFHFFTFVLSPFHIPLLPFNPSTSSSSLTFSIDFSLPHLSFLSLCSFLCFLRFLTRVVSVTPFQLRPPFLLNCTFIPFFFSPSPLGSRCLLG